MNKEIQRRAFVKMLGGMSAFGTLSLQGCGGQGSEEDEELPPEALQALLSFTDQNPEEEERAQVREALGGHLENIRAVRAHRIPQAVEPSLKFRPVP